MIRAHGIAKATRELAAPMGAPQPQRVTQMSTEQPELTPWFPGSAQPVRPGVYQRDYSDDVSDASWCRFDGERWYCNRDDEFSAMQEQTVSCYQDRPWRGLAEQSK